MGDDPGVGEAVGFEVLGLGTIEVEKGFERVRGVEEVPLVVVGLVEDEKSILVRVSGWSEGDFPERGKDLLGGDVGGGREGWDGLVWSNGEVLPGCGEGDNFEVVDGEKAEIIGLMQDSVELVFLEVEAGLGVDESVGGVEGES